MTRWAFGLLLVGVFLSAHPLEAAPDASKKASIQATITAAKMSMVADPDQALARAKDLELLARQLGDRRERTVALATARWLAGEAQLRLNAVDQAGPLLSDGLRLLEASTGTSKLRGDLLMSQGAYLAAAGKAAQALANYHAAYRIFSDAGEPRSAAVALQNIAMLYAAASDLTRAERYYVQAANTYRGDPLLSLSLRNNLGGLFLRANRYAEAEAQFLQALASARTMRDPALEARILGNLARAQIDRRKFDAAERTLARGFSLLTSDGTSVTRRQLLASAARLAADQDDLTGAVRLIDEAFAGLDLSTTNADFSIAHIYAYKIFSRVGRSKLALAHLEAMKRLNDEAAKVATTTSAALMAAKFDYQGQQLTIERLTTEQLRKTAEFQRTLFLSLGGATLAVIAMLSWGIITIRRSRNRVRSANVVLHHTNAALEKALAAKTEFLATTSHEIRTPLNGILGMTQVILSDAKLSPDIRDRLGVVHGAGMTMRALVDDILDVAKMETGNLTIDPAPMDLRETLREVACMWEAPALAKGLSFHLEISHAPAWIVCDAGRLRQIVFNLLSNAVKFTAQGGITVRAVAEGEDGDRHLKLVVADTGIGIPHAKLEDIFESFRQVDASTTRRYGGTGLGLTISRNLAEAMGGGIRVESREGHGTEFIVELPLVPARAPEQAGPQDAAGQRILIVDRNPIARSMIRTLLEPHGATLQFAATADEAAALLQNAAVATLLVEEATLRATRDDPLGAVAALAGAAKGARVVALWTKSDPDIREALRIRGAERIIQKPVAGSELIAALLPSGRAEFAGDRPSALVSSAIAQ